MNESRPISRYDRAMAWALPAIAALTPLVVIDVLARPHEGQTYFFELATLAAGVGFGAAWIVGGRPAPRRWGLLGWLAAANAASMALAIAISRSPLFSLRQALLPVCGGLYCALLILQPRRRATLEATGLALVAVGGVLAAYGILQHLGFEFLNYSAQVQKNKVIATIGHPNYLASALGPLVFLTAGFMFARQTQRRRVLGGTVIFLMLLCILLARTRAAWLGILVGLAGMSAGGAAYGLRRGIGLAWTRRMGLGAALAVGAVAVAFFVLLPTHARIDLRERLTSSYEIKSRLYYWKAAIDLGMERPLWGRGYAMYDPTFWDYALEQQKGAMGPYLADILPAISGHSPGHAHNEYLETFCEQGFLGIAALTALLAYFLYDGWRAVMRQPNVSRAMQDLCVYGGLLMSLVDAMFGFPWRLPVSLAIFAVMLAWLHDAIDNST